MGHVERYLEEAAEVIVRLDRAAIAGIVRLVVATRDRGGRLFVLGVGGSAANASHAGNDFRKIAGLEVYAPTDNVSELTARINDDGWDTAFAGWLAGSRLDAKDLLLVLSGGGGNRALNISTNLGRALEYGREVGASICGIVGRDGGYTAEVADACVIVPTVSDKSVTAHAEAFQAVVWHLVVTHPDVQRVATKWESACG